MSATVAMKARARMVERLFVDPPAGLANLYAALTWDVAPANAYGLMLGEPLLGDYARVAVPLGSSHWASSGFGEVVNTQAIVFPMATLDWGLLQGYALLDNTNIGQGEVYVTGSLQTPFYCRAGNVPVIAAYGITVGLYD